MSAPIPLRHMHSTLVKLDLGPLQIADLGSAQPMPIGDHYHRRIAMWISAVLSSVVHKAFDLARR